MVYLHPYRVGLSIVTKSVCGEVMRWWVGGVRGGCDSLLVFGKGQHCCHYPETHSTGGKGGERVVKRIVNPTKLA